MNASINTRNAEIKMAYIAGNTNKTELAAYFGVSVSTIRRVLAGIVISVAVAGSAVAATAVQYSLNIKTKADASHLAAEVSPVAADEKANAETLIKLVTSWAVKDSSHVAEIASKTSSTAV